ncbi:hypothetical protein OROMI_002759 [Orobanche minor]
MEDEEGLDLSLGLPCGGNSSSQKGKYGSSSGIRMGESDRDCKLINEFKNFLEGGNQQHPLKVRENIYNNFAKAAVDVETFKYSNTGGIWLKNDSRSMEIEEGKISSVGEKRKNLFIDSNHQKKHERNANLADLTDRTKASHISITTDEGSTAHNEDVAESEIDGLSSRHVSQHDDMSKKFVSKCQKDTRALADSSALEILGQQGFIIPSEKEFNVIDMPTMSHSVPFPGQPVNMITYCSPPLKDSNGSRLSSYPLPSMIHDIGARNGEHPGIHPLMPANFPSMFGCTPVQLPSPDMDNSQGIVVHQQQMHSTYYGKNPWNHDSQIDSQKLTQVISHKSSESTRYDERAEEHGQSYLKQQLGEEGSSSHTGDPEGNTTFHHVKDASGQPRAADSNPCEFPAIRAGIASGLKIGGCGSYPNLPWVSTTGQGPNGKTISGVTYKYSPTQIRIVCACHGSHMSPDEFVRHAAAEEKNTRDAGTGLALYPSSNPAASAQS